MSRRVYLLGVGLALVALAFTTTDVLLRQRPGVNEANVLRIRPGMTLAEVGTLLGSPAAGKTRWMKVMATDKHWCLLNRSAAPPRLIRVWTDGRLYVWVGFRRDDDGKVVGAFSTRDGFSRVTAATASDLMSR